MRKLIVITDPKDIVPKLKQEQREAGRTQKEIAEHLGFTEKHVSFMFKGKAGMSIPNLLAICAYLDVGVAFYPKEKP